jgi:hypothetical protein
MSESRDTSLPQSGNGESPSEPAEVRPSNGEAGATPEQSPSLSIQASAQSAGEQPASQRRVEANRKNALRSTGPKSQRGKNIASGNSLKHGLLAKSALITLGPAKESKAEFEKLLSGLQDYFIPVGTAEELLVEEIAVSYWMERRAQLYENVEICRQAGLPGPPKREPWRELGYDMPVDDVWISNLFENSRGYMLLRRPDGVEYLIGVLAEVKKEVEDAYGSDTQPDAKKEQLIGDLIGDLAKSVGGRWHTIYEEAKFDPDDVLGEVEKEKPKLELLKKKLEEKPRRSRCRLPDFSHTALLLSSGKLDLLQRYTAAHEKRRYRALAQLERLQRQRSGETIPAPIDVQVTGDAGDFAKRSQ